MVWWGWNRCPSNCSTCISTTTHSPMRAYARLFIALFYESGSSDPRLASELSDGASVMGFAGPSYGKVSRTTGDKRTMADA